MGASAQSALSAERPFPGLRPFGFDDHAFFYGRKAQFYELYNLLDLSRFIAVVGSSGSGKSSLVRAGLLPLLHEENADARGRHWRWIEMRPGDAPLAQLTQALLGPAKDVARDDEALLSARAERIAYRLRNDSSGIAAVLEEIDGFAGTSVLILVDQFEELFRFDKSTSERPEQQDADQSREEATNFVQLLLGASRSAAFDVRILLTMRSDFIGDCARFHGLPEAISETQFLVPALTRDQREQVIRGPLREARATIDSQLVERILLDGKGTNDELPVLQHCLLRLWEEAGAAPIPPDAARTDQPGAGRHLALSHYESIGGIARALSQHANEILAKLAGLEIAVEQTFRALSEIDKEGRATRRALLFEQLVAETGIAEGDLDKVVDRFRADDCSFLTPSSSAVADLSAKDRIDVGHEALLRRWERVKGQPGASGQAEDARLVGWLNEETRDGHHYQALLALVESDPSGRTTLPLDQVARHRDWWNERPRTPAWAQRYGGGHARVVRLLENSDAALAADLERRREAEEKERQERLSKAQAERRIRFAAVAFFLLFLAAFGFGAWAFAERRHADAERMNAERATQEAQQNLNIVVQQTNDIAQGVLEGLNTGTITTRAAGALTQQAEKTLDQLKQYAETPQLKVARVRLLLSVVDISYQLQDFDKVLALAQDAEKLARELVASRDPEGEKLLYGSLFRVGDGWAERQPKRVNMTLALAKYQEALKVAQQLSREQPDDGERSYNVAFATNKVGEAYQELDDYVDALAQFRAALEIANVIAAKPNAGIFWRAYPAATMTKIGVALASQPKPDPAGAIAQYDAAIKQQKALDDEGDHAFITSNLAHSHGIKADLLVSQSSFKAAFDEYEAAIQLEQRLADNDSSNTAWFTSLASFYVRYGEAAKACSRELALDKFNKAVEIFERLAQREKSNKTWPTRVAAIQSEIRAVSEAPTLFVVASCPVAAVSQSAPTTSPSPRP